MKRHIKATISSAMSVIDDQRIAVLMGRNCVGNSLRKADAGNRSS